MLEQVFAKNKRLSKSLLRFSLKRENQTQYCREHSWYLA